MSSYFKTGIFIEECSNRFLCKVDINGQIEICYLSSSSKLKHFITLTGREVLLRKNTSIKSKTQYTLHAVKAHGSYILLNLGYVNRLLFDELNKLDNIYSGVKNIFCEKVVEGLKADFVIEHERKTIIEAKGIITEHPNAYLPSMKVDRAILQLKLLNKLLRKGYCVDYYVVLMNPLTKGLFLDKTKTEFQQLFNKCLKNGMNFYIYKTNWDTSNVSVVRDALVETAFLIEAKRK